MTPLSRGRGFAVVLTLMLIFDLGLAQRIYRNKNGIRLQGGSGPRGRLEVSSRDAWFAAPDGRTLVWSPVCDSDDFTDNLALTMCQMLNYTYGRKYYSPSIALRKNDTGERYVGRISCTANLPSPSPPPGRRPPPLAASPSPAPSPFPALSSRSPPPAASAVLSSPSPSPSSGGEQKASEPGPASTSSPSPSSAAAPAPSGDTSPAPVSAPSATQPARPSPGLPDPPEEFVTDDETDTDSSNASADGLSGPVAHSVPTSGPTSSPSPSPTPSPVTHHRRRRGAARRSLYQPLMGTIATPRLSPYSCQIKPGACTVKGPFVGIECSHTPMVDAPPPPPAPPAPPPVAVVSNSIRWFGPYVSDYTVRYGDLEANLGSETVYGNAGRFEVLVDADAEGGDLVWAPLCHPSDPNLAMMLGEIACQQLYDWPKPYDGGIGFVMSQTSFNPFVIPTGTIISPGDFNPERQFAWASVVGFGDGMRPMRAVQDLDLTVSTEQCESGGLLAVACNVYGERRRA